MATLLKDKKISNNTFDDIIIQCAELNSLRDFARFGMSCFNAAKLYYGHGTDNAWDEAIGLILYALHLPLNTDFQILDARLTRHEKQRIAELFQRRIVERLPVPYITHQAYFAGLDFYVDQRVLIPRSPLAELIAKEFNPWLDGEQINTILDLCTGSGCLAIACADQFPHVLVDAVDIDQDALEVAAINVKKHALIDQVRLLQSDLFSRLTNQKYDLIISNPPYVDAVDMQTLPTEYSHEPIRALAAGQDGLDCVKLILQQSVNYLNPNGVLIVEVGNSEQAVLERYPEIPFAWLEFERGGQGVFLLTAQQLRHYQHVLEC